MHYVIVGNGVCGIEAALALRQRDAEARISLVSDEHDHFFSRPALMYVFAGQTRPRRTPSPTTAGSTSGWGSSACRGRVASLDATAHALVLEDGPRLGYDKLLLAVGSKARPAPWPGAEGPGLHYFVTLRDLEGLDRDARKGARAVVIGGGLIGVEVAEILHDRGLHVTFLIRENWYFPLALDGKEVGAGGRAHARPTASTCGWASTSRRSCADADGRPRAVKVDGTRGAGRPRGHRRSASCPTRGSSRAAPSPWPRAARSRSTTPSRATRARRVGRGRLRQRDLGRRLAPARAALVHRARPGPPRRRCRCSATRSPTAGAPGTTRRSSSTSNGRRRAGSPRSSTSTTRPSTRDPTCAPGSSACPASS